MVYTLFFVLFQAFVGRMGLLHPDVPLVNLLLTQARTHMCVHVCVIVFIYVCV